MDNSGKGNKMAGTILRLSLIALVAAAGCNSGAQTAANSKNRAAAGKEEHSLPEHHILQTYDWIYLVKPGGEDHDKHMGYLGTGTLDLDGHDVVLHHVYNKIFSMKGYYFDSGATYRSEDHGSDTFLGNHPRQRSLELIYKVSGSFRLKKGL